MSLKSSQIHRFKHGPTGRTYEEIGDMMGLSKESIRLIVEKFRRKCQSNTVLAEVMQHYREKQKGVRYE